MTFISEKERDTVWNPKLSKPLCRFVDYEFKTNDKEMIRRLHELGYEAKEGVQAVMNILDPQPEIIEEPVIEEPVEEPEIIEEPIVEEVIEQPVKKKKKKKFFKKEVN